MELFLATGLLILVGELVNYGVEMLLCSTKMMTVHIYTFFFSDVLSYMAREFTDL